VVWSQSLWTQSQSYWSWSDKTIWNKKKTKDCIFDLKTKLQCL